MMKGAKIFVATSPFDQPRERSFNALDMSALLE
jgi:hypothetical protein